jgi:hypothetical protein
MFLNGCGGTSKGMSSSDQIVDPLSMLPQVREALEGTVQTEVVRGIVSDYVRPVATAEPTKSIVERLVEKFSGPA